MNMNFSHPKIGDFVKSGIDTVGLVTGELTYYNPFRFFFLPPTRRVGSYSGQYCYVAMKIGDLVRYLLEAHANGIWENCCNTGYHRDWFQRRNLRRYPVDATTMLARASCGKSPGTLTDPQEYGHGDY